MKKCFEFKSIFLPFAIGLSYLENILDQVLRFRNLGNAVQSCRMEQSFLKVKVIVA